MKKSTLLLRGVGCVLGVGALAWSTFEIRSYLTQRKIAQEIRGKFSEHIQPLPPVPYEQAMSYRPSLKEVHLGRVLFNDPILSRNNDVSCATCHLTNHGFVDGNGLSVGSTGRGGPDGNTVGKSFGKGVLSLERNCGEDGLGFNCDAFMFRNVLSTVNVAYRANFLKDEGLLWDGRFGKLDFQVLLPIHTGEELCGKNPVPAKQEENPFRAGGPLFKKPVLVSHAHAFNPYDGRDLAMFNAQPRMVEGVPSIRPDGSSTVPSRMECVAIAIAKIRGVPEYRKLFEEAYHAEPSDLLIGRALSAFISTHVSNRTPYDSFAKGENALSVRQMEGMAIFMSPRNQSIEINHKTLRGAGCIECHSGPTFGGKGFASLGVVSDARSVVSRPKLVFDRNSFFTVLRTQRGHYPRCHNVDYGISASGQYAPDIGRANATTEESDCFKFRVPPLRNVIETYPYFHHGTARAQGSPEENLEKRSIAALKQVVEYHLRGPINSTIHGRNHSSQKFFDPYYQLDPLVPLTYQSFARDSLGESEQFPVALSSDEIESLVDFVAYGLFDRQSVSVGAMGNDVSHPKKVPSGFFPTITRNEGTQLELPPHFKP